MKIKNLLAILFISISLTSFAQNIGIGTDTPSTQLEVQGITRTDTLEIKNSTNKINSSINGHLQLQSNQHIVLDAGIEGSPNNSVFLSSNDINYVKFDGSTQRLGMGTFTPLEKIDISGAIKLGTAENENAGTIQWTGSDFTGFDGSTWKSLTQGTRLIDADGDSSLELIEGSTDDLELTLNNLVAMTANTNDSGTFFDFYSDPSLGVNERVDFNFRLNDITTGRMSVSKSASSFFTIQGDERVYIVGGLNLDSANKTNVSIGNHFSTNGVVINTGAAPIGAARALLDVKGKIETDGATFNDVINLTPMPKPLTAEAGDIYMDDGTCGPCNGFVRLRYYTGTNWFTVD